MYAGIHQGNLNSPYIIEGSLGHPSMTKAIMMGLKVEPRVMETSQSNRDTQWHIPRYPVY